MSVFLQDLIVSGVALGAVTTIGWRMRTMFASKPSGAPCGGCTKCPATSAAIPATSLNTASGEQGRMIRLTVIPASPPPGLRLKS